MDINKALRDLYVEKKRLDRAIAGLEARLAKVSRPLRSSRGRKNMNPAERLEVSRRMSAYWAKRRLASNHPLPDNAAGPVTD